MARKCIYNAYAAPELRMAERFMAVATKPKSKRKKKDAQLVLRLNRDLRDRFIEACQELDTTAAREVTRR